MYKDFAVLISSNHWLFEILFFPMYEKYSRDHSVTNMNDWFVAQNINIKIVYHKFGYGLFSLKLPDDIEERTQLILSLM